MTDKNKIIEKVYYDPSGFGSITATLKDVKTYDKSITYEDVKNGSIHKISDKKQKCVV